MPLALTDIFSGEPLQRLIENIRVDVRDHIEPTFRVPAVRIDSRRPA
jgi:hypothetical protein